MQIGSEFEWLWRWLVQPKHAPWVQRRLVVSILLLLWFGCSTESVLLVMRLWKAMWLPLPYRSATAHGKLTVRGLGHFIAVYCALNMIRNLTNKSSSGNPITFWVLFFRRIPVPTWESRDVSGIVGPYRCF
jgi:hypothetical protein